MSTSFPFPHRVALLYMLAFVCAGCASSRSATERDTTSLAALNHLLDGQPGLIHLTDGQTIRGRDIVIRADSIRWTEYTRENLHQGSVETAAVQRIERPTRRGPYRGQFLGLLGVAAGCSIWKEASACRFPPLLFVLLGAERTGELLVRKVAPTKRETIYRAPVTRYLP